MLYKMSSGLLAEHFSHQFSDHFLYPVLSPTKSYYAVPFLQILPLSSLFLAFLDFVPQLKTSAPFFEATFNVEPKRDFFLLSILIWIYKGS